MIETHDDRQAVYEIGYLLVPSVPEDKVPAETDALKSVIMGAGASIITEEAPHTQRLAYTMRRKTLSGSYDSYDTAYFGWVKFEMATASIERVKKAIEALPSVLRMLLITTVREQTYLGKRASAMIHAVTRLPSEGAVEEKKDVPPASIEEMDKSIDAMVKEA